MVFNRGSTEPLGSVGAGQRFRLNFKNTEFAKVEKLLECNTPVIALMDEFARGHK